MVLNPEIKKALDFNLQELFTEEKKKEFDTFIESLEFDIEVMRMFHGVGFANDKLYIDLRKCHWRDISLGLKGEFTLVVLLHEIGHMLRITANDHKLLKYIDTVEEFDEYFETVLEEEEFTDLFTQEKFEQLLGYPIPWSITSRMTDIQTNNYKSSMLEIFEKKQEYGSWVYFLNEYEKAGEETFDWLLTD